MASAYAIELEHASRVLERRAKDYRRLVVSVVALVLGSLALSATLLSMKPLVGILLLLPLCAGYFWVDAGRVEQWRRHVFERWRECSLDLSLLSEVLSANRMFPAHTLSGMLLELPIVGKGVPESLLSSATRHAIIEVSHWTSANLRERLALRAALLAVASGALVACASLGSWQPAWALLIGVPLVSLRPLLRWVRLRRLTRHLAGLRQDDAFDQRAYAKVVEATWHDVARAVIGPADP